MEANLRVCKGCRVLKQRIQHGYFTSHMKENAKDKRWVDETGKLWNGSLCPVCNVDRMKEKMRVKRLKHVK